MLALVFSLLLGFVSSGGVKVETIEDVELYRLEVQQWLDGVESELSQFNSIAAALTWELSTKPDYRKSVQAMQLGVVRNRWKTKVCESKTRNDWLTPEQKRKLYLLCRGVKFSSDAAVKYLELLAKMAQSFNSEICLANSVGETLDLLSHHGNNNTTNYPLGKCVHGEPDLERLMRRPNLNADQLRWVWKTWHNFAGPPIKTFYMELVRLENAAARNNGYSDLGAVWREELEMPNLEKQVFNLYEEIKPLYTLLHAVVRHKLLMKHGSLEVDPVGPIPVHLLGNMWGQDWTSLIDLFVPRGRGVRLEENLREKNWTVYDMVLQAEDMYVSLGLPKMTERFWKHSIFERGRNMSMCHGTAANMYRKNDFRLLMCAKVDMEDFYVIHHEMGHIQYFMAYRNKSPIFQDGSNSAMHESIGDAIMDGVVTPQHLFRLGLLTDEELSSPDVDLYLLLKQALSKIPEMPFALVVDKYRWDIFNGKISEDDYNKMYWKLNAQIRGVDPPEMRGEEFFDAGAKFHVPDNTPYIRYFLSSILQIEIFKGLCELSLYGRHPEAIEFQNNNLRYPLHRCDIYGSKKCGKKLLAMMEEGASIHWSQALAMLTGKDFITTRPLLEYFDPIYKWLSDYVQVNNVPVGW